MHQLEEGWWNWHTTAKFPTNTKKKNRNNFRASPQQRVIFVHSTLLDSIKLCNFGALSFTSPLFPSSGVYLVRYCRIFAVNVNISAIVAWHLGRKPSSA